MSMISAIFNILQNDEPLRGMLGTHSLAPDYPAIYENWATEDIPRPYIILSYNFNEGDTIGKQNNYLIVDIFTDGPSTIEAERIRDRLKYLFGYRVFGTPEAGPIRAYWISDGNIQEETPDVTHWTMEFNIVYFDASYLTE